MIQCCTDRGCSSNTEESSAQTTVVVDFLFLDLNQCEWCQGTEENLNAAVAMLTDVLHETGIALTLNKIHVVDEQQVEMLGFTTSPTIRINGNDIQLDYQEAQCTACSDLCGDDVQCRVWQYRGQEYTAPPKGMIIEAILREVYGKRVPDTTYSKCCTSHNLKKFFAGLKQKG